MKRNYFKLMVVIALLCTLFLSSCEFSTGEEETSEAPQVIIITATPNAQAPVVTEPPAVVPTEPPALPTEPPVLPTEPPVLPTEPPVEPTQPPAETEAPEGGEQFFRDEFDNGLDQYDRFIFKTDDNKIYRNNESLEKKAGVELSDGTIKFNIQDYYLYYYFIYQPQVYEDVKISVEVENLGYSASMAALICRYDENLGWYEVKVDSQGQWAMFYFDKLINKWNRLTNGGAADFNYGKDTNLYTLVCDGKEISFYVNDVLSQTVENKNLKSGKVGFSIQSPRTYTLMNVPWFEISEP